MTPTPTTARPTPRNRAGPVLLARTLGAGRAKPTSYGGSNRQLAPGAGFSAITVRLDGFL